MRCLTLNGWAQPAEGLASLMPAAESFDYAGFKTYGDAKKNARALDPELVIGWSLGGQLAVRLVAEKVWNPKKLVLLGAPYQFVAGGNLPQAMPLDIFQLFRKNYTEDNARTVARFNALIAKGDHETDAILAGLGPVAEAAKIERWLPWLDELGGFGADSLNFDHFPPTLLVHGLHDAIVSVAQAAEYLKAIPKARKEIFEQAGHALHLHDLPRLQKLIRRFAA